MSFRSGVLRRGAAALSCVLVLVLAGCTGGGEDAGEASKSKKQVAREAAEPSGPQDPRLQGEPLTADEVRKELCEQVVEYFPEDMVADASTESGPGGQVMNECAVENIQFDSQVTVKLHFYVNQLSDTATMEEIDANLLGDSPMCEKLLYSGGTNKSYPDSLDATSYGKNPEEYCGVKFVDDGYLAGLFIQNRQDVNVEMRLDPADSIDPYEVREEIMPYIMEGVKNFHSDQ